MATTTRVSCGRPSMSRLFNILLTIGSEGVGAMTQKPGKSRTFALARQFLPLPCSHCRGGRTRVFDQRHKPMILKDFLSEHGGPPIAQVKAEICVWRIL